MDLGGRDNGELAKQTAIYKGYTVYTCGRVTVRTAWLKTPVQRCSYTFLTLRCIILLTR